MATFNDLYNQFLQLSHQDRVQIAKNGVAQTYDYLDKNGANDDVKLGFFIILIGLLIGADGKITPNETDLFNKIFGAELTPQQLIDTVSEATTNENFGALNDVIDAMDDETKGAALAVALVIISADGEIDDNERAVFEELYR